MTRRKIAVFGLISVQCLLALLGLIFLFLDFLTLAFLAAVGSALVVTAAFIYVWRSLEIKNANAHERVRQLIEASPWNSKNQRKKFGVGRGAGAEIQVNIPHSEQEDLLFGPRTSWYDLQCDPSDVVVGLLGSPTTYESALPEEWGTAQALIPGMLATQAEQIGAGVILCDSSVFAAGVWRQAIDTAGEWLVQDLYRLKEWVDRSGAILVLFNHGDLPIGVNTETVRMAFNLELFDDSPLIPTEGAPKPKAIVQLESIGASIANLDGKANY